MGFTNATARGWSFGLKDFTTAKKVRDEVFAVADAEAAKIPKGAHDRDERLVEIYTRADAELKKKLDAAHKDSSNQLYDLVQSGAKLSYDQYKQLIATPMLSVGFGGAVPIPIRHSYSEGLDSGETWLAAVGARKSMFEKTQEVSIPGAINKQLANVAMDVVVMEPDCNSASGVMVNADNDALDRYTAEPIKLKDATIPKDTLITTQVLGEIRKAQKDQVKVRSPLRCTAHKGVCTKCMGLAPSGSPYQQGDNVGILATTAFGERGVQLALKSFHGGGALAKGNVFNNMSRVKQLLNMPEILPGSATLAQMTGKVTKVTKDAAGGHDIYIGDERHYVPQGNDVIVKEGDEVKKGKPMSTGPINPRELLPLAGVNAVQNYLTDELYKLYKSEGIKRIHAETLVRTLTDVGEVEDPGDHPDLLKTDTTSIQAMEKWNAEHKDQKPVVYKPVLVGAEQLPLASSEDWLARMAYRRMGETLERGTVEGWKSPIHGMNPLPGIVTGSEFGLPKDPKEGPY
jgi:DNA-directed RNA polymerase subunit beta'